MPSVSAKTLDNAGDVDMRTVPRNPRTRERRRPSGSLAVISPDYAKLNQEVQNYTELFVFTCIYAVAPRQTRFVGMIYHPLLKRYQMETSTHLLDKIEASARARITPATLDRHIASGRGPVVTRIGRRVFFDEADIAAWIQRHRITPSV